MITQTQVTPTVITFKDIEFTVKCNEPDMKTIPYYFEGPRGAHYSLITTGGVVRGCPLFHCLLGSREVAAYRLTPDGTFVELVKLH